MQLLDMHMISMILKAVSLFNELNAFETSTGMTASVSLSSKTDFIARIPDS